MIKIKVCKTNEWSKIEWKSYCRSFNIVFNKKFPMSFFKHKYTSNDKGYIYHSLLISKNKEIVGACSVIPLDYKRKNNKIKIGQAVDVFILEKFRLDPLMLLKMYNKLKSILIKENVKAVLAVPNSTAYTYWKKIAKWKDVGHLKYWVLPVRFGNLTKTWNQLNYLSLLLVYIWLLINYVIVFFLNNKEKKSLYEIVKDESFLKSRYNKNHKTYNIKDVILRYSINDEDGVLVAYILEAKQNNRLSFKAIYTAVKFLIKTEKVAIIIFIGSMKIFQTLLIKLPKFLEPKLLPLTCDILKEEDYDVYSDMLDIENWNYGLLNYDVR